MRHVFNPTSKTIAKAVFPTATLTSKQVKISEFFYKKNIEQSVETLDTVDLVNQEIYIVNDAGELELLPSGGSKLGSSIIDISAVPVQLDDSNQPGTSYGSSPKVIIVSDEIIQPGIESFPATASESPTQSPL